MVVAVVPLQYLPNMGQPSKLITFIQSSNVSLGCHTADSHVFFLNECNHLLQPFFIV